MFAYLLRRIATIIPTLVFAMRRSDGLGLPVFVGLRATEFSQGATITQFAARLGRVILQE
jgi:hypothetical protein